MKLVNPHLDHFPSPVAMFFDRAARRRRPLPVAQVPIERPQPLSWRQVANQVSALAHKSARTLVERDDRVAGQREPASNLHR